MDKKGKTIMKTLTKFSLLTAILLLAINATMAQKTYQQMTGEEQNAFVAEQSAKIAKMISSRDYAFTNEYQWTIKQFVDAYVRRINNGKTDAGRGDIKLVLERGSKYAPTFARAFEAQGVSPVIGIYLPMIESEYRSDLTSQMGATGMFQFIPSTAQKYGLTAEDRTNPEKEAAAAARFISELQAKFSNDVMKEVLALTSYNQGPKVVQESLSLVQNEQNKSCSICALNENKTRLNNGMQSEGLKYVPMFFAAAIIGENPDSFGIALKPLSSYTKN
jgi:hypothetical protein